MHKSLLVLSAVAVLGTSALADVAFNNFDSGDTFNTGTGWTISGVGSPVGANFIQGDQFVSATTGNVSSITIAMGYVVGNNDVTVKLYGDNAGALGSLLGTFTTSGMGNFGTAYTPSTIGAAGPALAAGSAYWLTAESDSVTWLAWNWSNTGSGNHYFSNNGAESYAANTEGAFRVETSPVPEPASMIALGSAAIALIRRRRSK